jgi:hypothetical protein
MDSAYFKMYVNERRMFNIPEFKFRRDSVIRMHVFGSPEDNMAVFITSVRVAESETDVLYDAPRRKEPLPSMYSSRSSSWTGPRSVGLLDVPC